MKLGYTEQIAWYGVLVTSDYLLLDLLFWIALLLTNGVTVVSDVIRI
jgi:hypothetical protein